MPSSAYLQGFESFNCILYVHFSFPLSIASPLPLFAKSVCFMLATSLWTRGPGSHHLLWKPAWSQETCASYLIPLLVLFWSSDHIKRKQKPPHSPKGMPASTNPFSIASGTGKLLRPSKRFSWFCRTICRCLPLSQIPGTFTKKASVPSCLLVSSQTLSAAFSY